MKKLLVVICSVIILWQLLPTQSSNCADFKNLNDYIPVLMKETAIPGIAIAKITAGKVSLIKTFGFANIEQKKRVDENTLFNLASISKPIMGMALLKLVDEGKLILDQDINDYLSFQVDNPHLENEKITIRHLASHTSGIKDYYDIESFSLNKDSPISLAQHLKSLLTPEGELYNNGEYFMDKTPGTSRKYSNLSAGLAGHIVEEVTGLTLAQYSKQLLFPSLSMPQASWLLNDLELKNIAVPYEVEQCIPYFFICADTETVELNYIISKYFNPPFDNKEYLPYSHIGNPQYPDGGVRASIKEVSQMLVSVLNNEDNLGKQLLLDTSYQEMFSLQADESVSDSQRFFWRDRAGLTGHMGSDLGVFTALYFDIESKTGFVILMNRGMDTKGAFAMKQIATRLMSL